MDPRRAEGRVSLAAALLAAGASVVGLAIAGVYRDPPLVQSAWRANDAVTLCLALPLLLVARERRTTCARLASIGALHYLFYNYAFYLFGAALNPLLLVYAAICALAVWGIVLGAAPLRARLIAAAIPRPPARRVAAWMLFVGVGLVVLWTAQWLVALARTSAAARFDLTPEFVRLVSGMDLTFMVSFLVPGAVLLWRGRPWGVAIGAVMNVSGALYNVVLAAGTIAQIRAGLAGAWPLLGLWTCLGAGCATAAVGLLGLPQVAESCAPARERTAG